MRTHLAVDAEQLADVLRVATPADTIHTCFPPGGEFPRLVVSGERWVAVSWTSVDTNGRWIWRAGRLEHAPSPPEP